MFRQVILMLALALALFQAQLPLVSGLTGMNVSALCQENSSDPATPDNAVKKAIMPPCILCVAVQLLAGAAGSGFIFIKALLAVFVLARVKPMRRLYHAPCFALVHASRAPPL